LKRADDMREPNEVDARVTKVLIEALGVDKDDIKPTATLQGDLGAESIDFLDIMFRLEREFMIRIPRGEFLTDLLVQDPAQFLRDGQVTSAGLAALRSRMPYADLRALEHDRRLSRISDLFTVGLLTSYVTWRLAGNVDPDSNIRAQILLNFARI
jgi:acyl carrier protein